ncbi:hypothetical protein DFJ73DRAFT_535037 [Zopfochytrium polystomum]|nr:hypothetical protein DFJ73DRAFT_535037 [Zopfochytrium polystomum]
MAARTGTAACDYGNRSSMVGGPIATEAVEAQAAAAVAAATATSANATVEATESDSHFLYERITDAMRETAAQTVEQLQRNYKLTDDPAGPSDLWGRNSLEPDSQREYTKHWDGLRNFCIFIGDYESLMILQKTRQLPSCPAVKADTVYMYVNFKAGERGSVLLNPESNEPVLVGGDPITCEGTWRDLLNVEQFQSAVSVLHRARGNDGSYHEPCRRCLAAKIKSRTGCARHAGEPKLFRTGNPCESDSFRSMAKGLKKNMGDYFPHGDSALSLFDLIRIRTALLRRGTRADLQLWVMIIVSVKLFLRSDEILGLAFDSNAGTRNYVFWDCSSVSGDGALDVLAFSIRGKCDRAPTTLLLYRDDQFPELCPIRAILQYVHECHVKRGYLFPQTDVLDKLTAEGDGYCPTAVPFEDFHNALTGICHQVLDRPASIGTHTLLKTAYFLAVWTGAKETPLRHAARHATTTIAIRFMMDAPGQLVLVKRSPEHAAVLQRLPDWTSPLVFDISTAQTFLTRPPTEDLHHAACHFMRLCGRHTRTIKPTTFEIAEDCTRYRGTSVDRSELERAMHAVPEYRMWSFFTAVDACIPEAFSLFQPASAATAAALANATPPRAPSTTSAAASSTAAALPAQSTAAVAVKVEGMTGPTSANAFTAASVDAATRAHESGVDAADRPATVLKRTYDETQGDAVGESLPPKKQRRGGDIALRSRPALAAARGTAAILDAVLALDDEVQQLGNKRSLIVDKDRQCYLRTAAVRSCFRNHFGGSKDAFVRRAVGISVSGFGKKCLGLGEVCGYGGTEVVVKADVT